jgi:hypothetical protein
MFFCFNDKVTVLIAILYKKALLFYELAHLKQRKADPSSRVDDCAQPLGGTAHEQTAGLRALDEALQQGRLQVVVPPRTTASHHLAVLQDAQPVQVAQRRTAGGRGGRRADGRRTHEVGLSWQQQDAVAGAGRCLRGGGLLVLGTGAVAFVAGGGGSAAVEAADSLLFRQDPAGSHAGFQTFLIPVKERRK